MPETAYRRIARKLQVVETGSFRMQTRSGESSRTPIAYTTALLMVLAYVQVDMRKRFRGNQAAVMVSDVYETPLPDAYSTLLTGQGAAREKKGRGSRRALTG